MRLPKFKIEDALDIPEERFHGLIYDGKDRLWIADGFTAFYADAKGDPGDPGDPGDVAGWVPVAAIHYAREVGQDTIYLKEELVGVEGATFERSQEKVVNIAALEKVWGKAEKQPVLVSVDLKRLVPVLQALLEANDAENYETVACSIHRGEGREGDNPLQFVTRVGADVHAILMPMLMLMKKDYKGDVPPYPQDTKIEGHWHVEDFEDDHKEDNENMACLSNTYHNGNG